MMIYMEAADPRRVAADLAATVAGHFLPMCHAGQSLHGYATMFSPDSADRAAAATTAPASV